VRSRSARVLPDSYRAQADHWCRGYTPPAAVAAGLGVADTLPLDIEMVSAIETLNPPHAWRQVHEELVKRLRLRVTMHQQWVQQRVAHPGRATDAAWLALDQRARIGDDAALAAQGFRDCAHRA
jgi:hypothetical protein